MDESLMIDYFLAGSLFWFGSFHLIWMCLIRIAELPDDRSCGIAMRLVSIIHAIMAAAVGTITVKETYQDMMYDDHWLLNYFAAFAYPYMLYDVYAMFQVFVREKKREALPFTTNLISYLTGKNLELFHHFISVFLGYPIILRYRHNKGSFIVGCVYITEYSTPFVNLRKILILNGYGSSLLFTVNNFLVLISFFVVRVALWPAMYVIYAYNKDVEMSQLATAVPYGCHIAMAIVMALQTSWFVLFCRGFIKLLTDSSSKVKKRGLTGGDGANGYPEINKQKDE